MKQPTNIYSINITGPVFKRSEMILTYNEMPIVCVTKKSIDTLLDTNKTLQKSIMDVIYRIGTELIDSITINVRIINSNRDVTNMKIPAKKYFEVWK